MIDYRQPPRLRTLEPRFRNYTLYREREESWVPWLRPSEARAAEKLMKRPICIINGAFDLLTTSHMRLIYAARHKCATLVCALDGNAKISSEKGPQRPIQSWIERAVALNYMPLDFVFQIETKVDMDAVMRGLRPDFRVQGCDYLGKASRYPEVPKILVRLGALRTSELIDRIRSRYETKPSAAIE